MIFKDLAAIGKGPTPVERFERRAEQIARAAEICKGSRVAHQCDFPRAIPKKGRAKIGCELFLAARNAAENGLRQHADPRVVPGLWRMGPECRDAVPFGLKRRVSLGLPVFDAAEVMEIQKTMSSGSDGSSRRRSS